MELSSLTLHVPERDKISGRLDFCQMFSGVLLIVFLWAHMLLVSSVLISPKLISER